MEKSVVKRKKQNTWVFQTAIFFRYTNLVKTPDVFFCLENPTSLKLTSTDKGRRHRSWLWDNESTCDFSDNLDGWTIVNHYNPVSHHPFSRVISSWRRSSRCWNPAFHGSLFFWLYLPTGGCFVGSQPVRRWSRWNGPENGPPRWSRP